MDREPDRVLDEYLVLQSRAGSRAALGQLVERWSPRLQRHAARLLNSGEAARDIVQETWLGALPGLARLDDPARFPAWIYGVATRKCVDHVRRLARARRLDARLAAEPPPQPAPPEGLDMAALLARLPADQRLVASLFYGEDLSLEEVAAAVGVPAGTVKSRLHNARQTLKAFLKGEPS